MRMVAFGASRYVLVFFLLIQGGFFVHVTLRYTRINLRDLCLADLKRRIGDAIAVDEHDTEISGYIEEVSLQVKKGAHTPDGVFMDIEANYSRQDIQKLVIADANRRFASTGTIFSNKDMTFKADTMILHHKLS